MWLLLSLACVRPPPAPEGMDDSSRFLYRNFYADDLTIGAGFEGFVNFLDGEGAELIDQQASTDNVEGFVLDDLIAEDMAGLPLEMEGRDLEAASGVIAISSISCTLQEAEALMARSDQDVVFTEYDAYERTYDTSREAFEGATAAGEWPEMRRSISPYDEGSDPDATASGMMLTHSTSTATKVGIETTYTLQKHYRHGHYETAGQSIDAVFGLSYLPEPSTGSDTRVMQNYGLEIILSRPDHPVLRMYAIWIHVDSGLLGNDNPIWQTSTVNTVRDASTRMSEICSGEATLPPEP
jgi:hypothetical protein